MFKGKSKLLSVGLMAMAVSLAIASFFGTDVFAEKDGHPNHGNSQTSISDNGNKLCAHITGGSNGTAHNSEPDFNGSDC